MDTGHGRILAVPPPLIAADAAAAAGGPFGFSRALPPDTKRVLLDTGDGTELPAIGGRTVIPADWDLPVILGHPNYFGRFERDRADSTTILLTGPWAALHATPPDAVSLPCEAAVTTALAEMLTRRARHLAKRLRQHRGVVIPFLPESPVIVALLPGSPHPDAASGEGVTFLAGDFPEFPGGVRIELPGDAATADGVRYAERLERLVTGGT